MQQLLFVVETYSLSETEKSRLSLDTPGDLPIIQMKGLVEEVVDTLKGYDTAPGKQMERKSQSTFYVVKDMAKKYEIVGFIIRSNEGFTPEIQDGLLRKIFKVQNGNKLPTIKKQELKTAGEFQPSTLGTAVYNLEMFANFDGQFNVPKSKDTAFYIPYDESLKSYLMERYGQFTPNKAAQRKRAESRGEVPGIQSKSQGDGNFSSVIRKLTFNSSNAYNLSSDSTSSGSSYIQSLVSPRGQSGSLATQVPAKKVGGRKSSVSAANAKSPSQFFASPIAPVSTQQQVTSSAQVFLPAPPSTMTILTKGQLDVRDFQKPSVTVPVAETTPLLKKSEEGKSNKSEKKASKDEKHHGNDKGGKKKKDKKGHKEHHGGESAKNKDEKGDNYGFLSETVDDLLVPTVPVVSKEDGFLGHGANPVSPSINANSSSVNFWESPSSSPVARTSSSTVNTKALNNGKSRSEIIIWITGRIKQLKPKGWCCCGGDPHEDEREFLQHLNGIYNISTEGNCKINVLYFLTGKASGATYQTFTKETRDFISANIAKFVKRSPKPML